VESERIEVQRQPGQKVSEKPVWANKLDAVYTSVIPARQNAV
jgi:hypothetical protein